MSVTDSQQGFVQTEALPTPRLSGDIAAWGWGNTEPHLPVFVSFAPFLSLILLVMSLGLEVL